jgi:hypothetical protein
MPSEIKAKPIRKWVGFTSIFSVAGDESEKQRKGSEKGSSSL